MSQPIEVTDEQVERAIALAVEARCRSYSPYSRFPMGAAVLDRDGASVVGALVENVSLGLAMCAERVALFSAVAQGLVPHVLAVCSRRTDDKLTFPCGGCLQVALEIGGPNLQVVAVDPAGVHEISSVQTLLPRAPHRFTPQSAR